MIKKIIVEKKNKTIKAGFELEIDKFTVITGENNTGKTNFIKAVDKGSDIKFLDETGEPVTPQLVYIAAENIKPSEDECKLSADSANMVTRLADLFSNLGLSLKLENQTAVIGEIENLISKANGNLHSFSGMSKHKLEIEKNEGELAAKTIIRCLVGSIRGNEEGEVRKIEDLGQGTQRIIVASILKAYLDILIEKEICLEQPVLILFEEPEIYLHPRMKRALNSTLEEISKQDNHQVIITTHDTYFAFMNFDGADKKLYSFEKKAGVTESQDKVISGIEDELLFMYLYSKLKDKGGNPDILVIPGFSRDYLDKNGNPWPTPCSALTNIRHQIHHLGDNPRTIGLIKDSEEVVSGTNYYTVEELSIAIELMSRELGS